VKIVSAPKRITAEGIPQEDLSHFQSRSGVGIADSEEVVMPLSPRSALRCGPRGSLPVQCRYRLVGAEARDFGQAAVELAFDNALDWGRPSRPPDVHQHEDAAAEAHHHHPRRGNRDEPSAPRTDTAAPLRLRHGSHQPEN
jgi:hypothetical protein